MLKRKRNIWKSFVIVVIFGTFLNLNSCAPYNPTLYPSYDILVPGPEVKMNPIAWIKDGRVEDRDHLETYIAEGIVVNEAYMLWVQELYEEVKKLRGD